MTLCVVCEKRQPDRPIVCTGDRLRLARDLRELPDLVALLPAVLGRQDSAGERVSGSREAPVPLELEVVDLLAPARASTRRLYARGLLGDEDQVGTLSVATILDTVVGDWRAHRARGERQPPPMVGALAGWLLTRLDDACDDYPLVGDSFGEIRELMAAVRAQLRLKRHIERLPAPCPTCDTLALYREVDPHRGASGWVECGGCHRLWSEDEYRRLVVILDEELRVA